MRLRLWFILMTALLMATTATADNGYPSRNGSNYTGPRWYGYFYNDNFVSANVDHTNITMVGATVKNKDHDPQESQATSTIEAGLQEAQNNKEKAMVDIGSILFLVTTNDGSGPGPLCFHNNPYVTTDFETLVKKLEADKYLNANDPKSSTVVAFYVADEPDINCLQDYDAETPNPTLVNAISVIRGYADTKNMPLAATITEDSNGLLLRGMALFDWLGLDDYGSGVTDYLSHFGTLEANSQTYDIVGGTPQHYFLVPLVTWSAGTPYIGGAPSLYQKYLDDDTVIGIMPFQWSATTDTNGMSTASSWAPGYIALGKSIVTAAAPPPPLPPPPPPPPVQISAADVTVIVSYVITQ